MSKLKKIFPEFHFSLKAIPKFLNWAVLLGFLIWNSSLFFGVSKVTDTEGKQIEPARPYVFFLLIFCILFVFLHGLYKSYGRKKREDSLSGADRTSRQGWKKYLFWSLFIIFNAVVSFHEIEFINNPWILSMYDIYIILGVGITLVIDLILVLLFNSVTGGMLAGNIFFLVWGMTNYYVLEFRTIPLQWIDFGSAGTAMSVAGGYSYDLTWQIVASIVLTCCFGGIYLQAGLYHLLKKTKGKIASRIGCVLLAFAFYGIIFKTDFLSSTGIWLRDWHPQYTYKVFGMESGFLAFAKASYPEQPDSYSADEVKSIISDSEKETESETEENVIPENIICIMNESFSDLSIYPNLKTDTEVLPNLNSLTENAQQGKLMVSVLGGTTANTEYEFLTGNSMMLSPTTVVYNSYIKQDQFSLARTLSAQGYSPIALHPYYPNGWNREIVYPRMGFSQFLSLDDFTGAEEVRGFVSDLSDYKKITELVENKDAGEKLFLFNVTMQNHSDYDVPGYQSTVSVEGYDGEFKSEAEQYESLVHLSDESLMYLIDYFSKSDEKTLICFWGDHQPALDEDFLEYAYGKSSEDLTFDEQQMQYETRYLIWANYDIPEKKDNTLSANYLSSYLLSLTGLESTEYNQYLMNLRDSIPALNAYGYLGTDGLQHEYNTDSTGEEEQEELEEYKCLIYDELTGGSSRDEDFYGIS